MVLKQGWMWALATCGLVVGGVCGACGSSGTGGDGGAGATGGTGSTTTTTAAGPTSYAASLAVGRLFTCAMLEGGVVRCWGFGSFGALGSGSASDVGDAPGEMPPPDVPTGGVATGVFSGPGANHVCATFAGGALRCWGLNDAGQLGLGIEDSKVGDDPGETPPPDVNAGGEVVQVAAGAVHTCALFAPGTVRCWGSNSRGKLGSGKNDLDYLGDAPGELPTAEVALGGKAVSIAAGHGHTCAIMEGGGLRCWGNGDDGQLGYGNDKDIGDAPEQMPPGDVTVGGKVIQVAAGGVHTCVLLDTGSVRCWGHNTSGQLGYGHTETLGTSGADMPRPDIDLGGKAVQIAAGYAHTCALLESGALKCWGDNEAGQLGAGNTNSVGAAAGDMPPSDVSTGGKVIFVAAGGSRTCVLLDSGALRCWGNNSAGELGYGDKGVRGDEPGEMPTADIQIGGTLQPSK